MPHILLPLLSAHPRFHGFLSTVWCDFPAVTHTLMAPRRFVPVRRSQSLFEELWERPLIRRRRSRFGRSLALAGTPCQNHNDEKVLIPNDEVLDTKRWLPASQSSMGSAHSAGPRIDRCQDKKSCPIYFVILCYFIGLLFWLIFSSKTIPILS